MLAELFITHSTDKLGQMTGHIEDCLDRLTVDQIWHRGSGPENSVGNLVLHLCGNLGQFVGHYIAGRPDLRNRPAEFAADSHAAKTVLKEQLRAAVDLAKADIAALTAERLAEPVTTKDTQTHILNVVYQVVGHFQQHTGQIMFATKQMTQGDLGFYVAPAARVP
ncbi:MAG TPA: DinB family protein [Bryobacteraceae bacterium]|jgi:hypothetical protein